VRLRDDMLVTDYVYNSGDGGNVGWFFIWREKEFGHLRVKSMDSGVIMA